MGPWTAAAVQNNAEWCDLVCRAHGAITTFDDSAWTSAGRTPLYYPDAITLNAEVAAPDLLARIDHSAGCSIKDSYATTDLRPYGFQVLFDAEWIVRSERPSRRTDGHCRWQQVCDREELVAWEAAWQGDGVQGSLFLPQLLEDDRVTFLVAYVRDVMVAGAILNVAAGVVGISNFFTRPDAGSGAWDGCMAFAQERFPGAHLVGYASGANLTFAIESGFSPAGPLRVWVSRSPSRDQATAHTSREG